MEWKTAKSNKAAEHPFGRAKASRVALALPADADGYDPGLALTLSVVSAWAYSDRATLADKLPYYGLPDATVTELSVTNDALCVVATAYFIHCGELGILVFRGTEPPNIISWLTDANTMLRPFHFGKIHSGFFANVEVLWRDIVNVLGQARAGGNGQQPLKALYLAGHSLGGAMAVVAAARAFAARGEPWKPLVRGIYTYGQPMVGDREFAQGCCQPGGFGHVLHRHVYHHDVVPHLPPLDVDPDYWHFGWEHYADSPDESWVQSSSDSRPTRRGIRATPALLAASTFAGVGLSFLMRRLWLVRRLDWALSIDDHSPEPYMEASRHRPAASAAEPVAQAEQRIALGGGAMG